METAVADAPSGSRGKAVISGSVVVPLLALVCAAGLLLGTLWALFPGFGHGIDVSDEGLYFAAADTPDPTYNYVGLWGVYLHPMFALVGHDIARYRFLGAVVLAIAAWLAARGLRLLLLGWSEDSQGRPGQPSSRLLGLALDLALVSSALLYYALYLVTPSYNWLALVGILLAAAGLLPLLVPERSRPSTTAQAGLVTLGSFVAFVGRPTAGLGVALLGGLLILGVSSRPFRDRLRPLVVGGLFAVVLLVLHLTLVLGWADSVESFRRTAYFASNDSTTHGISALIRQSFQQIRLIPAGLARVAGWAPLLGALVGLAAFAPRRLRAAAVTAAAVGSVLVCALVIWLRDGFGGGPHAYVTLPFAGFALILTALVAFGATAFVARPTRDRVVPALRWLAVAVFFVGSASLYSFSSNNGLIYQMHGAFVLLAASALVLLLGTVGLRGAVVAALALALIGGVAGRSAVGQGATYGYRTDPPAASTAEAVVSHRDARLGLGPDYAAFYVALDTAVRASGFVAGTPLVDLTPFSPGIGYAMGASPPTTLMLGFSPAVARWALGQQDLTRWRDAWLLLAPAGPRRLDPVAVVDVLGRAFPADYERVAVLTWPQGPVTYELWRPRTP